MAKTEVRGGQIKDTTVNRDDLDISTAGKAVVRRIIAGSGVNIGSTGVDTGTGDVTINAQSVDSFEVDGGTPSTNFSGTLKIDFGGPT